MSTELEALEAAADSLHRSIVRAAREGASGARRLAKLETRVGELEDKIAALGLAESRYAASETTIEDLMDSAIRQEKTITFRYTAGDGMESTRTLSPYGTDESGLFTGWDHTRDAIRRFRPSRIGVVLGFGAEDFVPPVE